MSLDDVAAKLVAERRERVAWLDSLKIGDEVAIEEVTIRGRRWLCGIVKGRSQNADSLRVMGRWFDPKTGEGRRKDRSLTLRPLTDEIRERWVGSTADYLFSVAWRSLSVEALEKILNAIKEDQHEET